MARGQVHFEVFVRRTPQAPWRLEGACESRSQAVELAESLFNARKVAAARVSKEVLDPATGEYASYVVLAIGAVEETKKKKPVREESNDPPCVTPAGPLFGARPREDRQAARRVAAPAQGHGLRAAAPARPRREPGAFERRAPARHPDRLRGGEPVERRAGARASAHLPEAQRRRDRAPARRRAQEAVSGSRRRAAGAGRRPPRRGGRPPVPAGRRPGPAARGRARLEDQGRPPARPGRGDAGRAEGARALPDGDRAAACPRSWARARAWRTCWDPSWTAAARCSRSRAWWRRRRRKR